MSPIAILQLSPKQAVEVNFVITKFRSLTPAMQRLIYEGVMSDSKSASHGLAGAVLADLLIRADRNEVTAYVNKVRGTKLAGYLVSPEPKEDMAYFYAAYFRDRLSLSDEAPVIEFAEV